MANKKLNGTVIVTYRCNARCSMCNRYKAPSKPEEEISIETIKKLKLNLSFPVMIDTEYGNDKHTGRADNIDNESRTDAVIAFLERIMEAGYQSAIYASNSWFKDQLNYNRIKKYPKWVAKYSDTAPTVRDNLIGWQKSSHGENTPRNDICYKRR